MNPSVLIGVQKEKADVQPESLPMGSPGWRQCPTSLFSNCLPLSPFGVLCAVNWLLRCKAVRIRGKQTARKNKAGVFLIGYCTCWLEFVSVRKFDDKYKRKELKLANLNDPQAALDVNISAKYNDLKILHDVCVTCVRCDLAQSRTQVVFGEGQYLTNGQIKVMAFGEAPGGDEDKQGRPFVGRSGRLLTDLLREAGLPRESLWLTNTAKCRPTITEGGRLKDRPPTTVEQKACEIWWQNEVELVKPSLIICFGATAAKALLNDKKFQITKDRGQWLPGPQNTQVMVTFHPSYVMRQQGEALDSIRNTVLADIGLVKTRLEAIVAGQAAPQPNVSVADDGQMTMF